jgi:hypothetical protein
MSMCVMCANPVAGSPIVGIGRMDLYTNTGQMTIHPVCAACHTDPSHRLLKVKVHFAYAEHAGQALEMARHLDALSREGRDLAL